MRRRRLKRLWASLHELRNRKCITRDDLLMYRGALKKDAGRSHIFVSFLAFCLHTTLRNLARGRATGLTSEAILEKMSNIQMIDVHLPTTDGRHIVMSRHTQPDKDVSLLLAHLGLSLPEQPPPKVYASGQIGL